MAHVAATDVDVVLVPPTLPDMPAATLLGQVRTLRPSTSRMAVIGNAGTPPARIIGLAHRFLPAPLAPELLLESIGSLEELRVVVSNPQLRDAVGKGELSPSSPQLYLRLMHALENDDVASAADSSALVAAFPAIAPKVSQLFNSAFFSTGSTATDLRAV